MVRYDRNARSLDSCRSVRPQPLNALGASAIKSRSFQSRYPSGDRPFPRSSLDDEPDAMRLHCNSPTRSLPREQNLPSKDG